MPFVRGYTSKKGQVFEIIGIGIILLSAIIGVGTIASQEQNLYVGDVNFNTYYKYSECKSYLDSLPEEKILIFRTKEAASNSGMVFSKCPK